jgi:hypothetical protein
MYLLTFQAEATIQDFGGFILGLQNTSRLAAGAL